MQAVSDIVVLVPGFLGFNALGRFGYFAQSVAAAIRVALEEQTKLDPKRLVIVPSDTVPGGSLAERQRRLSRELSEIVLHYGKHTPPGELRVHLLGHSTGGLDAELLTYERPLGRASWSERDELVRRAIRSVVTVAAPLGGTHLADSALARLLTTGREGAEDDRVDGFSLRTLSKGSLQLAQTLAAGSKLVGADLLLGEALLGALLDARLLTRFARSLLLNRSLLSDLRPAAMRELMQRIRPDAGLAHVHRARFVTVARNSPKPDSSGELFETLYALTAQNTPISPEAQVALQGIHQGLLTGALPVIGAVMPPCPLTQTANDGIVNTGLQLSHWDVHPQSGHEPARIAALVVADHVDVLGYFPPESRMHRDRARGFLTSGSDFREPQFSALARAVAGEVAHGISPVAIKRLATTATEARQLVLRKSGDTRSSSTRDGA